VNCFLLTSIQFTTEKKRNDVTNYSLVIAKKMTLVFFSLTLRCIRFFPYNRLWQNTEKRRNVYDFIPVENSSLFLGEKTLGIFCFLRFQHYFFDLPNFGVFLLKAEEELQNCPSNQKVLWNLLLLFSFPFLFYFCVLSFFFSFPTFYLSLFPILGLFFFFFLSFSLLYE
jgi:hypothetical protein